MGITMSITILHISGLMERRGQILSCMQIQGRRERCPFPGQGQLLTQRKLVRMQVLYHRRQLMHEQPQPLLLRCYVPHDLGLHSNAS